MTIQRFDITPLKDFLDNGYTVLVPNQRIRDAILCGFACESASSSWRTPDVNAVDVWMKNQWENLAHQGRSPFASLRLLNSMEESLIWIDIVEQNRQHGPLLNMEEAAASAQRAYQLYRLWLDDGQDSQQPSIASGTLELQQFSQWARIFSRHCREQQVISLADATHTLLLEISCGNIAPPENVLVVNFYQPPPLYKKLFLNITKGDEHNFLLTADRQKKMVGQLHTFVDLESEVRACVQWSKQLTESQPDAHIGIVFGGDSSKQPVIDRIFKDVYNPEGFADLLHDQPLYNGGLTTTSILEQRQIDEALLLLNLGNSHLDSADFCHLLQSPTLHGYDQEREARIQLEVHIRQNLGTRCSLSQLLNIMSREDKSYYCPILLNELMNLANQIRSHRFETPDVWARLFQAQLTSLGWPAANTALENVQEELLQTWQAVIASFSSYRTTSTEIDRSTALSRLRTLCQKATTTVPFNSSHQISLYNLIDAVGMEFSHVWFLGFDDSSQPPAANPSPFITHKRQREAAIPGSHSEIQLELTRQAFDIICASTQGEIHGSYHLLDGDESFRISSLIASFSDTAKTSIEHQPLNSLALTVACSIEFDDLTTDTPVSLALDETPRGGQAILSDQSSCPFRAFANHRLDCEPLDPFSNGLDARTRGTALHIALEKLFSKITGYQQLRDLSAIQCQDLVAQCSEAAVNYLGSRNPELMTPRFKTLERQRLHRLLGNYLDIEKKRDEYQVFDTEKTVSWNQEQLNINLKIDRIDRLGNGKLGIIDYKTGKYVQSVSKLTEERPENLQLPLYYWAASTSLGDAVDAVVIAQINAEKVGFHGLAAEDNFHPDIKPVSSRRDFGMDWQSLTSDWHTRLSSLAKEFNQGVARVDPVRGDKTCEYCRLQPLCRIRQLDPSRQYFDQDNHDQDSGEHER